MEYEAFIGSKMRRVADAGFEPARLSPSLFPFQRDVTAWAVRKGRAAVFASTGLGKTRMQVEWAREVAAHTGGRVLILAPLAVAPQTVAEGQKLGVPVTHARDGAEVGDGITVTNYDRLHRFDPSAFAGVVLDESSVIKHYTSKTLATLLEAFASTPYRLSATATPAPNDWTELGTQAEFLGVCTRTEMLAEFFVHDGGDTSVWRLKGHARREFWRWVAGWAALIRKPSDLGYDDGAYALPPLAVRHHTIAATEAEAHAAGRLFVGELGGLQERRAARKASMGGRVERCAALVKAEPDEAWIVWCELNAEHEALEREFGDRCISIYGSLNAEEKERRLLAWLAGERPILLTKAKIAGYGINAQHCARMAFVGVSDSWESYHQAVRRIWRFGQARPVAVHLFASEIEGSVTANLERKEREAERLAGELAAETSEAVRAEVRGRQRTGDDYVPSRAIEIPSWMGGAA